MLGIKNLEEIMESHLVSGKNIMHNCLYINKSGVVTNIDPSGKYAQGTKYLNIALVLQDE